VLGLLFGALLSNIRMFDIVNGPDGFLYRHFVLADIFRNVLHVLEFLEFGLSQSVLQRRLGKPFGVLD